VLVRLPSGIAEGSYSHRFAVLKQKETNENLRTQFPTDRKPYSDDYDYDADSDLDEDEDWDSSDVEDFQVAPSKDKSDKSDSSTLVGSQSSDVKGNRASDIISVSDMDSLLSDSVDTKIEAEVAVAQNPTHIGTVAAIEDVAFVTYVCSSFPCFGLADLVQQITGAAPLLVHERDRVCAMGFCGKTESTRP